jgi:DNA-directed RNA polymerase subunit RPC12/RpoP
MVEKEMFTGKSKSVVVVCIDCNERFIRFTNISVKLEDQPCPYCGWDYEKGCAKK